MLEHTVENTASAARGTAQAPARATSGGMDLKPFVLMYAPFLAMTGGAQHTMTLNAIGLARRDYPVVFYTRRPFDPNHRYIRWLRQAGIPVRLLPHFQNTSFAAAGAKAAGYALTVPYAVLRRRSLRYSWQAAQSIFATRVARFERADIWRRFSRELKQGTADGRRALLHIWGPAGETPLMLEWAEASGVKAIYHEMGEADELYVKTWHMEGSVAAMNRADQVICVSPSVAETARRVFRYRGPVVAISDMIVDPGDDAWQRPRVGPPDRVMLGAIGRLVPHKRHADLITAVRRLKDEGYNVGLVIAGEGIHRRELERQTAELNVTDRVTFTGEFEELADVMAMFDIFTLTSSSESQCMPVTESMAYQKPVIVSQFGGIPDFVEEGRTGFLVAVGDVDALVDRVKILVHDPALRAAMGQRARQIYLEKYQAPRVTDQIEAAYRSLWSPR